MQVRLEVGDGLVAVGRAAAREEGLAGDLVLLGADLLHDVDGEQAAELGGALVAEAPAQRGEEAGAERVADAGGLDLLDLGDGRDDDRLLALAVDAYARRAEGDDPRADPGEDLLGAPAGLLGDQAGFVLVGEQDLGAVDERPDQVAVAEGELLRRVGQEAGSRAGGTPRCAGACPAGRPGR